MLKVANSVINASQITGVLPVVNGGTGVTTSTGTGNTVLSASPTLSGDVNLSTGNLVIGTAGKGIDFSITSSGSGTMTSELLADYEEGTWSPIISTSSGPVTSYSSSGTYVKVGKAVVVTFNFTVTNYTGGGGSGVIGNLPFASSASAFSGAYRESATTGAIHTLMYYTSTEAISFASVAWNTGSVGSGSFCYTSS